MKNMSSEGDESASGSIRPIDKNAVHKICSGQVIVTLAVAVKELIENSLDAGSNSIEVRLKNYGSECIEVIDNGSGIEPKNFKSLTLKHHTSKLSNFSDILSINTFGFRGEALSSLCALSDVTILTCHKDAVNGSKLEYDHNNQLVNETVSPMQVGTTVILKNIFSTLPVRHREFMKNLKKEFNKLVQILYGYGLISYGKRFLCTNQVDDGKKTIVFLTHGKTSIKDNICSIFGPKQQALLAEFKQHNPSPELLEEFKLVANAEDENFFMVSGFISSCKHGSGRNASDRQFFFINGRPCEANKLAKIVNEVYHMFNRHQYPFVALDINLRQDAVDVNVTPDKRQIIFENEKLLLCTLKSSLLKMYETTPCTVDVQSFTFPAKVSNVSFINDDCSETRIHGFNKPKIKLQEKDNLKRSFSFIGETMCKRTCERSLNQQKKLSDFLGSGKQKDVASTSSTAIKHKLEDSDSSANELQDFTENGAYNSTYNASKKNVLYSELKNTVDVNSESLVKSKERKEMCITFTIEENKISKQCCKADGLMRETLPKKVGQDIEDEVEENEVLKDQFDGMCSSQESEHLMDVETPKTRKEMQVSFNLDQLRSKPRMRTDLSYCRRYKAKISPQDNTTAEEELKMQLSKDMFSHMDIIGQFNLGFIIAKLNSDVFIIDQHATDEKYNYEMLQKLTVIENQKLVCPMDLELTAVNESILIDNLDIFRKNGFDFLINDDETATHKVKLISVPTSKNWIFGKDDVEELIFMLSDSPETFCRPSRVQKMFASRACRTSVMIGTSLSVPEMRKLVQHMGMIEQPWNCPHGRPTIRHLIDLKLIKS